VTLFCILSHYIILSHILQLLLIQMIIANGLAILCYYGIIKNRKQSPIMPFLVTFGVVVPLTTWVPFYMMDSLDIRSTVLRMGLVALPICVQLTCLQGIIVVMSCDLPNCFSSFSHIELILYTRSLLWIHSQSCHFVITQFPL